MGFSIFRGFMIVDLSEQEMIQILHCLSECAQGNYLSPDDMPLYVKLSEIYSECEEK